MLVLFTPNVGVKLLIFFVVSFICVFRKIPGINSDLFHTQPSPICLGDNRRPEDDQDGRNILSE